jgi:hypothetical protein
MLCPLSLRDSPVSLHARGVHAYRMGMGVTCAHQVDYLDIDVSEPQNIQRLTFPRSTLPKRFGMQGPMHASHILAQSHAHVVSIPSVQHNGRPIFFSYLRVWLYHTTPYGVKGGRGERGGSQPRGVNCNTTYHVTDASSNARNDNPASQ